MSVYFNYASGVGDIFIRSGAYLPGQIAKSTPTTTVEALNTLSSNPAIEFGQVVKRSVDPTTNMPYAEAIETSDTADDLFGIAVKDVTSQAQLTDPMVTSYRAGQQISVLTKGYIAVPVHNGTPKVGGQVYVRNTASSSNSSLPIGGIEAGDSTPDGTVAWAGATFETVIAYPLASQVASTSASGITTAVAVIKIS